jgi:hypothetical protein
MWYFGWTKNDSTHKETGGPAHMQLHNGADHFENEIKHDII